MNLGRVELIILALIILFLVVPLIVVLLSGRGTSNGAIDSSASSGIRPRAQGEILSRVDQPLGAATRSDGTAAPAGGGLVPNPNLAPDISSDGAVSSDPAAQDADVADAEEEE